MKGWQIFMHSVRLVLNNLGPALKISAVLYMAQVAQQLTFFMNPPNIDEDGLVFVAPDAAVQTLVLSLISLIAGLWIAVAWHRYVLANEEPQGWLPRWHGSNILSYLGRSIMIGLLIGLGLIVAAIPVGLVGAFAPGLVGVLTFGLIGLASYLFFRMGVMLPSAAMGEPMRLGDAWSATNDNDGAVVVLALLVIAVSVLVQIPSWLNPDPGSIINLIYGIVTGWFVTIIGVSVLTTLYGHYVQGRPID
ncbi:hypothetical protein [Thalassococcus lentus]|uniref:Uncharacterized protein n=1 Tax=Thalassococcus lentus TaxID=1210524 RepID=A0ABT4XNA4_9RHOB|nr:hypothetical protein [Thalassococcus lentus]MDA7423419.1 hypothetical protein [Thalassococcus lentus]